MLSPQIRGVCRPRGLASAVLSLINSTGQLRLWPIADVTLEQPAAVQNGTVMGVRGTDMLPSSSHTNVSSLLPLNESLTFTVEAVFLVPIRPPGTRLER